MKNLNLTELEEQFLSALIDELYAEAGFSDVDINEISKETGVSTKILRGVQSSLVRKGIIDIYENSAGYQIIYLDRSYWYLHPEWKDEVKEW